MLLNNNALLNSLTFDRIEN